MIKVNFEMFRYADELIIIKQKRISMILGFLYIIMGLTSIIFPFFFSKTFVISTEISAVLIIISGILLIIDQIISRYGNHILIQLISILLGITCIAIGILFFLQIEKTLTIAILIFGLLLFIISIIKILSAIVLRDFSFYILIIFSGIIDFVLFIMIIINKPFNRILWIPIFIGIELLLFGINSLILNYNLGKIIKK